MKCRKLLLKFCTVFFSLAGLTGTAVSQSKSVFLTWQQAFDDLKWLKFSLEYVHPRLYKYDDKKTVDARFVNLEREIGNKISGTDFLSLITKANAAVHCGHLYTIAQGELEKELLNKKVLPFYIKCINNHNRLPN